MEKKKFCSLVKMESAAEGESLRAALICVKRADRQRTDCRVNTRLLSGPRCTLRLHDSLHVLLTQCALWRRDGFLSLAVHSLRSGGEICTTDSDEFQRSCVLLRLLTRYIERLLTKCHQIFKFDDLRKCLFLLLPFFFFLPLPRHTLLNTTTTVHSLWCGNIAWARLAASKLLC